MSIDTIVLWIQTNAPATLQFILMGLGGLVIAGQCYVVATPRKDDDAFIARLEQKAIVGHVLRFLKSFSPIQPKHDK